MLRFLYPNRWNGMKQRDDNRLTHGAALKPTPFGTLAYGKTAADPGTPIAKNTLVGREKKSCN